MVNSSRAATKIIFGLWTVPFSPAVYEMDEFINYEDAYFGGIPTAQVFSEAAQQVIPVYKGRNYYSIDDVIKEALDNVSAGDDRDEEWSASLDTIDRILAR